MKVPRYCELVVMFHQEPSNLVKLSGLVQVEERVWWEGVVSGEW